MFNFNNTNNKNTYTQKEEGELHKDKGTKKTSE